MASRSIGRKNQNESREIDREDDVRGRADEMDDAPPKTDEFEDPEDLNDEGEEEGEGSL